MSYCPCQAHLLLSSAMHLQGAFQVTTQQPINYKIEEVDGLLDPANKVSQELYMNAPPC